MAYSKGAPEEKPNKSLSIDRRKNRHGHHNREARGWVIHPSLDLAIGYSLN
jgi:hypothetical protein